MATLEQAIALAAERHTGQVDKANIPYILHLLRIMLQVQESDHKIVAVLHDILEDTATTIDELYAADFQPDIVKAIVALTKQKGASRVQAAQSTVLNPIARVVKLANLADNMDLSRIESPTAKDFERLQEYQQVRDILFAKNVE
ncbi:HD domain-containing protein [Acinetobacter sp. A47]|uniref:HD domain-containing protein n=1 Tax=Acinetobacter sp. A47 TaxID=1561217 RepID=UPI00056E441C|nr:HD domain-containing protein [Acinetobacter sp. A47]